MLQAFSSRSLARIALTAFLATSPAPIAFSQTQPDKGDAARQSYVIHETTHRVLVDVVVTDDRGKPVSGLKKSDFSVWEDKKPQTVAVFEKQSETPLSVVMAIDTSGSMMKDARLVREAARQFVNDVIRPQDEMEVLQFATSVSEIVPFTSERPDRWSCVCGLNTTLVPPSPVPG